MDSREEAEQISLENTRAGMIDLNETNDNHPSLAKIKTAREKAYGIEI